MSWRLFLIRHGMTEGNREKRYIGKTDEGLCDEGRRMLERRKAAGVVSGGGFGVCQSYEAVSGKRRRCCIRGRSRWW